MTLATSKLAVAALLLAACAWAQPPSPQQPSGPVTLGKIRMRDVCILADHKSQTYYMIGPAGRGVRAYTSKDLVNWAGPEVIFRAPDDIWGIIPIVSIWAPEMHAYKGRYYLFLTFDTRNKFAEQWRDWLPRVTRGSQVLVGDAPTGPFKPFQNHSTLPVDMMTLDGTLWVEDGVPYMVFCHEWVQISNGTVEAIRLKDDLSETVGEPKPLFHGSEAPWNPAGKLRGNYVTDGPYLYTGKFGKLFLIWSGFNDGAYTTGIAISDSGKLAGPWKQQAEPLFKKDGGHGMLFKTFEGQLMMVLHSPNNRDAQPRLFKIEDTGETLRVISEFTEPTGR